MMARPTATSAAAMTNTNTTNTLPRWSIDPARRETAKVVYRAFELGLVLYYVGVGSNVLEMTPSLLLGGDEAAAAVEILGRAIADVEAGRVADDAVVGFAGW